MEVASWRTTIYYLMETFTSQSGWRKAKKNENTCFFVALQGSWRSSDFAPNQHKYNNTYITITCTSIQVNNKSLYLFFRYTHIIRLESLNLQLGPYIQIYMLYFTITCTSIVWTTCTIRAFAFEKGKHPRSMVNTILLYSWFIIR